MALGRGATTGVAVGFGGTGTGCIGWSACFGAGVAGLGCPAVSTTRSGSESDARAFWMTSMSSSSVRPNSLANLTAVPMRYTPHFCPPFHWGMGMGSPFPNCCGNTSHLQPWELARPIPALGKGRRGRLLHVVLPEEDFGGDLLHGLGTNGRHARGLQPPPPGFLLTPGKVRTEESA